MKKARIILEQLGENSWRLTAYESPEESFPFMERVGTMDEIRKSLTECSYYVEYAN